MKKLSLLALLPVIALSACGKTQTPEVQDGTNATPTGDTSSQAPLETEATTPQPLNPQISQSVEYLEFEYKAPNGEGVPVTATVNLKDGKVESISIEGADTANPKSPVDKFAVGISKEVVGKELKGLQINTISGASYVSKGFNEYLKNL